MNVLIASNINYLFAMMYFTCQRYPESEKCSFKFLILPTVNLSNNFSIAMLLMVNKAESNFFVMDEDASIFSRLPVNSGRKPLIT
jgi:hypothetical protein